MKRTLLVTIGLAVTMLTASTASAFCGFYVSGADAELYNNATMVSLMRDGKRTVLSMQNNYEGPPKDFAMVVPVPVVLKKKDVKTLPSGLFNSLDSLTAPRLVEYWERDPCYRPPKRTPGVMYDLSAAPRSKSARAKPSPRKPKVKVEAKFKVGEYDIVILSSTESTALEDWLNQNNYNIPDGAAPYFKPYVQKGQYFFVAKVNIDKVKYKDGEAVLSPIRFHYDSDDFVLPVRLGLINSKGAQDLIAFIIAKHMRYEVANFPNVTIPTNIPVKPETKNNFASFYSELFDNVLEENPQAVVTEYSWNAATCDPCPKPPLKPDELLSLGADVLPSVQQRQRGNLGSRQRNVYRNPWQAVGRNWVVTRLHTRYGKHTLGEDLVFRKAEAIRGGRGMPQGAQGKLGEQGAEPSSTNQFQGRYVIRHFWDGEIECNNPRRGVWGGPGGRGQPQTGAASNLAFSEGTKKNALATYVDDQEKIPGLKKAVAKYDEPAGDVIESWGKLVEAPSLQESDEGAGAPDSSDADTEEETSGEPTDSDETTETDESSQTDEPDETTEAEGSGQTAEAAADETEPTEDESTGSGEDTEKKAKSDSKGGCASSGGSEAAIVVVGLLGFAVIRLRERDTGRN